MRILNAAICTDNNDPKGIGRIRFKPFGEYLSEKERSVKYNEWDMNDPFIAIPFLPLHINIVPQNGQSVKLMVYDTDKNQRNIEYIPGPFTSSFDLENQTFLQQLRDTTYSGNIVKDIKDVISPNGKYVNPKTNGSLIKIGDTGIKGNYGSDIIFTNNGVQIRGGFLPGKSTSEYFNDVKKRNIPILSNKMGRFTLKKFDTTKEPIIINENTSYIEIGTIKYILEYEIVYSESLPIITNFYLYKVMNNYGNIFNTNIFNSTIDIHNQDINKSLRLINEEEDNNSPTYTISADINTAHLGIRNIINRLINNTKLKDIFPNINSLINEDSVFPFYFLQRKNFSLLDNTINDKIISQINFKKAGFDERISNGLFYSKSSYDPIEKTKSINKKILRVTNNTEQSFSSLSADKIFLISTTTNGYNSEKKVNFEKLDKYELTQEDYLENFDENTFSLVRGEVLLNLLKMFYEAFDSHIHQINKKPIIGTDPFRKKLDEAMKEIEGQLLNKSIKLN